MQTGYFDYNASVTESELVTRGFQLFDAAAAVATSEQAARIAKLRLIPEFAHSYAMYEIYGEANLRKNISNLLADFFLETAAGRKLSSAERSAIHEAVVNYVCELYKDAYEEYNRDVLTRALSYGIYQIYEGMPIVTSIDDPNLNLKTTPDNWRPKN